LTALYVDSSALLKRVVLERESTAVRALLRRSNAAGDLLTASSLAWLEVWRTLRRGGLSNVSSMTRRALAGIAEFPLSDAVLAQARYIGNDKVRALDAIHLASAVAVGAEYMLTYDVRLAESAVANGIDVLQPVT
jgi:predicted nucleic acid-binding protein